MDGSDAKRNRAVERVRAMLAKAAATDFEAEAQSFEEHALRLMAAYEIEERELRDSGTYESEHVPCHHFGNAQTGAVLLISGVARMFGAYPVQVSHSGKFTVSLTATPPQFDLTMTLVDHLFPQLMADITRDRPRSRRDYSIGWATKVLTRLELTQHRVYAQTDALVPTTTDAEHAFKSKNGPARKGRRLTVGHEYNHGVTAGERADLNQQQLRDKPR